MATEKTIDSLNDARNKLSDRLLAVGPAPPGIEWPIAATLASMLLAISFVVLVVGYVVQLGLLWKIGLWTIFLMLIVFRLSLLSRDEEEQDKRRISVEVHALNLQIVEAFIEKVKLEVPPELSELVEFCCWFLAYGRWEPYDRDYGNSNYESLLVSPFIKAKREDVTLVVNAISAKAIFYGGRSDWKSNIIGSILDTSNSVRVFFEVPPPSKLWERGYSFDLMVASVEESKRCFTPRYKALAERFLDLDNY